MARVANGLRVNTALATLEISGYLLLNHPVPRRDFLSGS
ncbi:hypothetical protein C7S13_7111 [Burkholderia cepacia]|nr:hypothetical protein [Burkholderia cepacia]